MSLVGIIAVTSFFVLLLYVIVMNKLYITMISVMIAIITLQYGIKSSKASSLFLKHGADHVYFEGESLACRKNPRNSSKTLEKPFKA